MPNDLGIGSSGSSSISSFDQSDAANIEDSSPPMLKSRSKIQSTENNNEQRRNSLFGKAFGTSNNNEESKSLKTTPRKTYGRQSTIINE